MITFKKKKKIITCSILLFSFLSITLFSNLNFETPFYRDDVNKDDFTDFPKTSASLPTFNGVGDEVNISLHQSYSNNSFNTIVNTSIVNGNNFTLPSPTDISYNSSYTNITLENIVAPNKSLDVETNINTFQSFFTSMYTSFEVPYDCYLTAVEINIDTWSQGLTTFTYDVYGAKYDTLIRPDTTKDLTVGTLGTLNNDSDVDVWLRLDGLNQLLNTSSSETYNNTFFIQISSTQVFSQWNADSTNGDTLSYQLPSNPELGLDFSLKIDVAPLNNTPSPEQIGLKINSTLASGYGNGLDYGYWESYETYSNQNGKLKFNVSADWWDVECNISQVQINYTKTDLKATSEFNIANSGQDVVWNVTRNGGLNYFDADFSNYRINFTIPATWHDSSIKVSNGSNEWSINKRLLGNGYREIKVPNAINGTFWFLNATSSNLIISIDTYVEGGAIDDIANYTDILRFNTTFTEIVKNGNLNLSVYSPTPNYLNHTNILDLSTLTPSNEFNVSDWNISDIEIQYGVFVTRIAWSNDTAAGFLIGNLTILGETELTFINLPPLTFDASDVFNITAFFNDIGYNKIPPKNISDGDISYSINFNDYKTDNITPLGDGLYNITIDCNDTEFNSNGPNSITINASKQYYNNQSETIDVVILGETSLTIIRPSNGATFDSSNTFNITVKYNNTIRNEIINTPNINYSLDGGITYRWDNITSIGNNKYNISVNCYDTDFGSYGSANIIVNASKSYYYNQSEPFSITITGNTALTLTKLPDPSIGYYNSDEIFNITAYLEDISRSEGINEGLAKIYVKEVSASSYQEYTPLIIDPLGAGYYNITVDCSDPIFNPYGKYNIKINITKSYYYTAEEILGEIVVGNTTLTILDPTGPVSYVEDEIFDIMIEYEDHTLTSGIAGADITYTINGTGYRFDASDNSDGTYNITVDVGDADFGNNYGYVDIIIRANKTNYINLTRVLTFERQILTQITPFNNPPLVEVIKGENVIYTFNYSDTSGNPIVEYDIFQRTSPFVGFQYNLLNDGNGNYTLDIDTSNVAVTGAPFKLNFSISVFGNQSQEISLTILVTIIQTSIEIESWNDNADFARSTWINVSIDFYFNDTTNIEAIDGLIDNDVIVRDYDTGIIWSPGFELFNRSGPGNYKLNISTVGKNSGLYTLQLNISKHPNYTWSLAYIQFYLRGNYTQINMISVSDPEATLISTGIGNNYTTFIGSDLTIKFNITDTESNNNVVIGDADEYIITFKNLITGFTGTLQESLSFVPITVDYGIYTGSIVTSVLTANRFYLINITVVKSNYENTTFSFNLTLVNSQINIIIISNQGGQLEPSGFGNYYNSTVALDLNLEFNITDTESLNKTIARDATLYLVKYINLGTGQNGTILNSLTFNLPTSKYIGSLTTSGLGVGNYLINVSVVILNYKIIPLTFNLTIVYANSNIVSITNLGGQLPVISNFYDTFIGGNIGIEFNISDVHFETIVLIGAGISYSIYYQDIDTLESGTLQHTLSEISLHSGSLNISLLPIGNYSFSIIVAKSTNNITSLNFLLRIIEKYETRITITKPESVNAGLPFKIIIKAEFFNGIWLPATGSYINITLYYNSRAGTSQDDSTNSTGEIEITIPTYSDTIMLNLTIQLRSAYNHQGYTEISDIDIIPIPPSFGFEDILPYLIIAAIAVLTLGGSVAIYRGVVVPKKREKQRILTEVKTIFDDAINLEHILVLYKGTGTCIFFKSYGSEQIDPELIGGFLSAVSSFGKEMATQEALNEISYGDKMLLLADGALIRVALVLGKNASLILRRHLKEFIGTFEKTYSDSLPKWRGQLNPFRNAGTIVDDLLNTSIILPHQISYDFSKAKDLKNPHSKEVLKIAQSCCEEAEREFFFIATLLKEVADRTNKDTAEIFMGIKELRDKKILIPIEISAIGEQPVSQQEINLINQKVIALTNLTNEEKQKLVDDLAQLGPIEREAYLSSLVAQQEIVTAPIKTTIGDLSVENQKAAKKGIKELLKRGKIAQNKKNYIKAVEIYQGAAMLASNWELTTEFHKIQETIRKTRIEDLNFKKSNLENEAKSAIKENNYPEAAVKYKYASKMASEIFKLGGTEMTKEVKRLTNKANEYEKMK